MAGYPYRCPVSKSHLEWSGDDDFSYGKLIAPSGEQYPVSKGMVDFSIHTESSGLQKEQQKYYEQVAKSYDDLQGLTFEIQRANEQQVRQKNIDLLNLSPDARVLDLACGTGNDSTYIVQKLDSSGIFCGHDISPAMIEQCYKKLTSVKPSVFLSVGSATHLPFEDNYFDAVFSFGGLNVFEDKKQSLKEMVRVTKTGGRVVFGDESMPPWLYGTEFGEILMSNNALFKIPLPLNEMPVEAREVCIRWIIGGVYYLIDFTVGEGEPEANFDLEIPGVRGGTLNTRYYGRLEGVSSKTKSKVLSAASKQGKSVYQWLDEVLHDAATKDLNSN